MSAQSVLALAKEKKAKMVDLKFVDFLGIWQHFSVPIGELNDESLTEGFGFDGSSIRGWQAIHNSDMLIIPDATTAKMDPFTAIPTLSLIGNVIDPITRQTYEKDPRNIALKAENFLKKSGAGDTAFFGPEAEFFIFDDVRFDQQPNGAFYQVNSSEGFWNSGREEGPNLGYKPRLKEGYFPVPPTDTLNDLRNEMVMTMEEAGIEVECQHHEVASAGQAEIDIRFAPLVKTADNLMWFKYIVKNVAKRHNKTVTFMPKPIFGDNGSGMHIHMSLWKDGKNLFAGNKYANLSDQALHFIGGILQHAPALLAFCCPTTNSYRRLVPGYEAPINLAYSSRNRSAAVRIPVYSKSAKAIRMEFRTPDPSANPYLAFSALLMAGLDGVKNKINPGKPLDQNLYALSAEEKAKIPKVPAGLDESLDALARDHEFLLEGEVFTRDVIHTWIDYKMENEVAPIRLRPVPHEFNLYYDV